MIVSLLFFSFRYRRVRQSEHLRPQVCQHVRLVPVRVQRGLPTRCGQANLRWYVISFKNVFFFFLSIRLNQRIWIFPFFVGFFINFSFIFRYLFDIYVLHIWDYHSVKFNFPNYWHLKDIDECAVQPSICPGGCLNTPGSYECTCGSGFQLDVRLGRTCVGNWSQMISKYSKNVLSWLKFVVVL